MNSNVKEWRGSLLEVRARAIPRFLFMTVSIDVLLDGEPVLRTGGKLKHVGSVADQFLYQGQFHDAELSWSKIENGGFPFILWIDGETIFNAKVAVDNLWLVLLLWLGLPVIIALGAWSYFFAP